jgi:hypothetical protein
MANGADMKDLLDRIEAEIAGVKRQYDLFFQGIRRSEPSDKRREVEETVRRMGQRKIVNSNDQFRFHGLQSRFYSLSNLWVRMVRDLEEGRMKRVLRYPVRGRLLPGSDGSAHTSGDRGLRGRRACSCPRAKRRTSPIPGRRFSSAREIARKSARKVELVRVRRKPSQSRFI